MFPLLHLGRPWFFYWLLPYPNTMRLWPQFRSALVWDVFAVSTYFTVSLMFWYMGMIPDLATLRDRADEARSRRWSTACWRWAGATRPGIGTAIEMAYLLLGGLATPLVVSVHSVVSSDFAISIDAGLARDGLSALLRGRGDLLGLRDGAAAVHSHCGTVYGLQDFITLDHLEVMAKIVLATSLLTSYGYLSEQFVSWYGGEDVEHVRLLQPLIGFGQYAVLTWLVVFCNTLAPQVLWFQRLRRSETVLLVVSLLVLVGMWMERYVIIITSLHRDYLPSSWGMFKPTIWDYLTYFGSFGMFFVLVSVVCPLPADDLDVGNAGLLPDRAGHEEGR